MAPLGAFGVSYLQYLFLYFAFCVANAWLGNFHGVQFVKFGTFSKNNIYFIKIPYIGLFEASQAKKSRARVRR